MTYDNPEEYLDEEEEKEKKRRRWCIRRALDLAEKRKTKEEKSDMDSDDIANAAEKFNDFVKNND